MSTDLQVWLDFLQQGKIRVEKAHEIATCCIENSLMDPEVLWEIIDKNQAKPEEDETLNTLVGNKIVQKLLWRHLLRTFGGCESSSYLPIDESDLLSLVSPVSPVSPTSERAIRNATTFESTYTPLEEMVNFLEEQGISMIPMCELVSIASQGSGNFGQVEIFTWKRPSKRPIFVAVKFLRNPDPRTRLEEIMKECRSLHSLRGCDNVVQLFGAFADQSIAYMVFEYADGGSLEHFIQQRVQNHSFLHERELALCFLDIARGVYQMHEKNYLHRDIAAKNCLVFLDSDERSIKKVKIADFGLCRYANCNNGNFYYTSSFGFVAGVERTAPEVWDHGRYEKSSDIFCMAITFAEISNGQRVFAKLIDEGITPQGLMLRLARGERPDLPCSLSLELKRIIEMCWEDQSEHRPTAAQVVDMLENIDRKDTVTTRSLCVESNKLVNSEHLDRGSTDISMITCSSFDIVAEECIGKCSENSCCTNVDLLFQTASRLSNRKVKNRFRELELAWRNGMHEIMIGSNTCGGDTAIQNSGVSLELESCSLSVWGHAVHVVVDLLRLSQVIPVTMLNVRKNRLENSGCAAIAEALTLNNTLLWLNLSYNRIGDAGCTAIAQSLLVNTTLQEVMLQNNEIKDTGATSISKALERNTTLQVLNLWGNQIGESGAHQIALALQTNKTLKEINLTFNSISAAVQAAIRVAWNHRSDRLWI